ncbi:MAG TPA: tetratricopeptide repeat protein [Pyrinomonadaceae bacterium]|nr:tetratricopeptide repeat protein [Pyrinomonadaceae bacterium]
MKRHSLAAVAAPLCLLLLLFAFAPQQVSAKETWTTVRSKNFFLIGNASDKDIRRVATKLEQFRDVFTRLFPAVQFNNPVPTTVVVFKSDGAFKPYKPVVDGKINDVAGYFQPGEDVNYIALTAERGGTENPFETIYHEYVHLLVNNNMAAVPPWFNEGLAEYYSTFDVDDERKVYLGKLIENYILLLRRQQPVPLKTLFELDYDSLHRNRRDAKTLFYAQAWALVHYLVLGNEGKRLTQMGRFLALAREGKGQEQAFREAFATDYAGMEKELREYVRRNDFKMKLVTFDAKLEYDAEMQSAPLGEADALAYLGDLLLHTHRLDEAAAKLREALALAPDSPAAHASLGMTLVRQNRHAEAREHLRRAVALDSRNYLAHYYYAAALSQVGRDASGRIVSGGYDGAAVREMRASLARAIELRPDFAESYRLLAFINLVAGEQLEESVAMLRRAMTFAPGREEYLYILAQIFLRQEKYEDARRTAEQLASSAEPQLRADAQSLLSAIKVMQEQAARFQSMREREDEDEVERAGATDDDAKSGDGDKRPRLRRLGEEEEAPPEDGRTPEERAAEAFSDALNEALRKPQDGETRASGALTRIECGQRGLVFHVRAAERVLKLSAADFNSLHIMAYTQEAGSTLTCGALKSEARVVVTYRAPKESRTKNDGELAALEFVPAGFKLRQ